jgi:hypothetical protein
MKFVDLLLQGFTPVNYNKPRSKARNLWKSNSEILND